MDWLLAIGSAAIVIGVLILILTLRRFRQDDHLETCFAMAIIGGIAGGAFVGFGLLFIAVRMLFYFWIGG